MANETRIDKDVLIRAIYSNTDASEQEARAIVNTAALPPVAGEAVAGAIDARGQEALTGAETETLVALVERGPLSDGDVPSKSGRDSLVARGLAARVLVSGQDGYQAATYAGRDAYQARFGAAETTEAATANRVMTRTLCNARKDAQ